jgi:heme/copper-type cytochrome/quinol oxidase subunit 3
MAVTKPVMSQDATMSDGAILQLGRMLILAGTTFFAPFFFAFAVLEVSNENNLWRPAGITHPSKTVAAASVAFLIVSGLAYLWGQLGLQAGLRNRFAAGLGISLIFSIAASVTYVATLRKLGFTFTDGGYASVFICLTNVYLAVLIVVNLFLVGLTNRARLRLYDKENMAAINAFGEFYAWFIAVGVGAFAVLYIVPFIVIQ